MKFSISSIGTVSKVFVTLSKVTESPADAILISSYFTTFGGSNLSISFLYAGIDIMKYSTFCECSAYRSRILRKPDSGLEDVIANLCGCKSSPMISGIILRL